jgi:sugar lactone lactonase YvrE
MTSRRIASLLTVLALAGCGPTPEEPLPTCDAVGDICTIAGTGIAGFGGDGGPATKADLYLPMDFNIGPDQQGYVIDWNNHRVRRITLDGSSIVTVAGKGELGDETAEGVELETSFNHPTSGAFDPQGRLVIAAWHNSRLKRLNVATGELVNICGTGKRAYTGDGGPADKADLDLPTAVAFDPDGVLYFMDQANQMIRRVDADNQVTRVAGRCVIGTCVEGEMPVECPGSLRVACGSAENPDACKGACTAAFAGDGGLATDARIAQPVGQAADPGGRITFDAEGTLYFADTRNHRLRKVAKDGTISTVAGTGTSGYSGDGGPATEAKISKPIDLEFGPDGRLYFTDMGNSCVRAIATDGIISTVAGTCGKRGVDGDGGPATAAKMDHPYGLAFDRDGNLWVADTENSKIRKVRLN